jgi:dGTPase
MKWTDLLTQARLAQAGAPSKDRTEFQEDYDKIIFSSAFRRLQGKTQVFALSGSDYVRTRLTHSLEVSCVGRALSTMVGNEIDRPDGTLQRMSAL